MANVYLYECETSCMCSCMFSQVLAPMWTCHCNEAAYEAEVREVVWVDSRCWVDLQTVVTLSGILKQTVHGIQNFMGQQEEPLSER